MKAVHGQCAAFFIDKHLQSSAFLLEYNEFKEVI